MSDDFEVSQLRSDDIESVVTLWDAAGLTRPWNNPREDIELAMANPTSTVLVGRVGTEIVASAMPGFDGHRASVYYLAVRPNLRGRGYGRQMMAAVEAWVRQKGAFKLNLIVRSDNGQVGAFYESIGYQFEDRMNFTRRLDGAP